MPFRESRKRSVLKAITFRVVVVCFDLTVIFLITNEWNKTFNLVIVSNLVRVILYYGHERFWNRIRQGKETSLEKLKSDLQTCQADLARLKQAGASR